MIDALLYQVQIKALSKTRVEITLIPTWVGRLLKRRMRRGVAYRAKASKGKELFWWWDATDRYVGTYIERYIEAAPMLTIEDLTVEQLLLDDPAASPRSETPRSKKRTAP